MACPAKARLVGVLAPAPTQAPSFQRTWLIIPTSRAIGSLQNQSRFQIIAKIYHLICSCAGASTGSDGLRVKSRHRPMGLGPPLGFSVRAPARSARVSVVSTARRHSPRRSVARHPDRLRRPSSLEEDEVALGIGSDLRVGGVGVGGVAAARPFSGSKWKEGMCARGWGGLGWSPLHPEPRNRWRRLHSAHRIPHSARVRRPPESVGGGRGDERGAKTRRK